LTVPQAQSLFRGWGGTRKGHLGVQHWERPHPDQQPNSGNNAFDSDVHRWLNSASGVKGDFTVTVNVCGWGQARCSSVAPWPADSTKKAE
jgi:hypothetical protein